ncbi:MAG: hypothetical protein RLN75_01370 [Longimicrobiales bacterium]
MPRPGCSTSAAAPSFGRRLAAVALAASVLGGTAACSDGGTSPDRAASVSVYITTAPIAADSGSASLVDGTHRLTLDRVALVVSEVGLAAGTGGQSLEDDPFLLDVPVGGGVRSLLAAAVAPGRYDGVRIGLHAPDPDDPADQAFLAAHPDLAGASVRVEGSWNGEPFTWTRALDEVRVVALEPPLDVWARTANVTLLLDVGSWFRAADGSLIDPATAMGDAPMAAVVESRIRASFAALVDPDADGTASDD